MLSRTELALALFGAFVLFRPRSGASPPPDRWAAAAPLSLVVAISVLQCAFYVQGRHRFLIEPLLLIFTATGLLRVGSWRRGLLRRGTETNGSSQ